MGLDLGHYSDKNLLEAYKGKSKWANLMAWIAVIFTFSAIWIGHTFRNLTVPLFLTGILMWLFAILSVSVQDDYEKEVIKRELKIE